MLTVSCRSFYFIWIEHPRWGMQQGSCPASSASELALWSAVITPASKTGCATFELAWGTVGLHRAAGGALWAPPAAFFAFRARGSGVGVTMSGTSVLRNLGFVKKKVVLQ